MHLKLLIGTLLLASQGATQNPTDLTAVVTQMDGQVTLSSETRSVRRAAQRQVIRRGEVVHVPAEAQVSLICSTETLVTLTGPRDWVLDAVACGRGIPVPASSYQNLASFAGRILPRNGSLLLELEPRHVDLGRGPVLLSPRHTATLEAHPLLVWTRVPDALEYEIKIRGPVDTSIRLAARDLHCGAGSGPWRGLDICSWAPAGKWPALEPEKTIALSLSSRRTLTASFPQVRDQSKVHLLAVDGQRSVQERLRQIAMLSMDNASRLLLTAGAYAQAGLYADSIATYDEALQAQDVPEARVTLGDLYLRLGLTALADREYHQVLAGAPDSAAGAAAEAGLGQASYIQKRFDEARAHFERAHELYAALGLPAEAEDAKAAADRLSAP